MNMYDTPSAGEPVQVLHIEDNIAYARLIKESLIDAGSRNISLVNSAKMGDALTHIDANDVDLILLDLSLPDASGVENVRMLRNRAPDTAIVVLTGTSHEEMGLQAVQYGAQDYLSKDICGGDLLAKTIKYAVERQRNETKIRDQALTDGLTGLPNRAHFMDFLGKAMARSRRLNSKIALLYFDFDGFKQINDSFGHIQGDKFLVESSKRLKKCLRSEDFCARLGGDEFAVIADIEQYSHDYATPLAKKIIRAMRKSFKLKSGEEISPSCSVGVCSYDGNYDNINQDQFIQSADEAMYRAKRDGGDCYRLYDEKFASDSIKNSTLIIQLRSALKKKQFFLEYQPIINLDSPHGGGIEALLRWTNDEGQNIPPSIFIGHLENIQMIRAVGEWVINEACEQFHDKIKDHSGHPWISINVSPLQLNQPSFLACVERNLQSHSKNYPWLVLEITENVFMGDAQQTMNTLKKLVDLGVVLAIDDFGTGYSSMQYLMELPAKILKVDRSFVKQLEQSKSHQLITKGMIRLAQALGKKVIVEGVETLETAELLKQMGANYLQGYYFSKPININDLDESKDLGFGTWG